MLNVIASVVLLCSALSVFEIGAMCPFQNCICDETFTICRDRNPTSSNTSTGITPPTIDLNNARSLTRGVLPANLTEIYLHDSPIVNITDDAFDESANTVITLSLTNCHLSKIPNALIRLRALIYLTISDTNILDWNEDAMTSIGPKVITFFLSNVGLNSWPEWIKTFNNVTEFNFEGSSVSAIPDDAFNLMTSLTSLSLDNNKLSSVPKALSQIGTLRSLYMADNAVSDLTWLPKSSSISILSLNGNKLSNSTHLSNALLLYANSLTEVDFGGNLLTSLPALDFLTQVTTLGFSNNKLSDLIAGTFPPKLDELDLSSNLFSSIPRFTLALQFVETLAMTSNYVAAIKATDFAACITMVQLDKNLITQLTDTSFPQGSGIISLVLDYNPLKTISQSAFNNLASLKSLSLRNSQLTRLPMALTALTQLNFFDISGSRYLVCTCSEKALENWVVSTSAGTLNGDCGLTSISTFFTSLSPRCPPLP
ncbi:hypothetical protein BsWGS_23793 [Bradybaena similaris]